MHDKYKLTSNCLALWYLCTFGIFGGIYLWYIETGLKPGLSNELELIDVRLCAFNRYAVIRVHMHYPNRMPRKGVRLSDYYTTVW